LYLVLEKQVPPESILALTFTRKAAAEMASRLYEALTSCDTPMHELTERLAQSHIQTLDSFCKEIVSTYAIRYGYTPEFAIDEDLCRELAKKTAYHYVLSHMEEPGLASLLDAFGFDAIVRHLFASFGTANIAPHWQGRHFCAAAFRLAEAEFRRIGRAVIEEASALVNELLACASQGRREDFREETRKVIALAERLDQSMQLVKNSDPLNFKPLRDFVDFFNEPSSKVNLTKVARNDPLEQRLKELFQILFRDSSKTAREKKRFLDKFSELADFEIFLSEYREIMNHLDRYAESLCEEKRRANVMDFKDLGLLAEDILKQDEETRRELARRFRHILIDEFQDNNSLQKRILMLLSLKEHPKHPADIEEGKLFFVGDEKQSIYLFRGADVSVFQQLANELGATPLRLVRNYRSCASLIHFFNQAFPYILRPEDPEAPYPFEAIYAPMEASEQPEPSGFESHIEYHLISGFNMGSAAIPGNMLDRDESQAFRIARWILHAVKSSSPLMVRQGSSLRPAQYADIAILMRSGKNQYLLEKYLRMLGIPFTSESGSALFSEQPINDLYYMLRLLLDDSDIFATAAVLRSPLCRISNDGYVLVLSSRLSLKEIRIELASERKTLADLSQEDMEAVQRLISLYEELEKRADHLPLLDLVDLLWDRGYLGLFLISDPRRHHYLDHWNSIRAIAARIEASGGGVSHLCEVIRDYMCGTRVFDSGKMLRAREEVGVRLLTVHKSKGLEFPIVIIPWMESKVGGRAQDYWGILDAPIIPESVSLPAGYPEPQYFTIDIGFHDRQDSGSNFLQTHARTLRSRKESAETRRLLYVACTRAIDHLAMFGSEPSRNYDSDSFHACLLGSTAKIPLGAATSPDEKPSLPSHLESLRLIIEPPATDREVSSENRAGSGAETETPDLARIAQAYERAPTVELARPRRRFAVTQLEPTATWNASIRIEHLFEPSIAQVNEDSGLESSVYGT
ncbi:MAG: UvrD-helicase domain-containing protein, partial [Rectinema sp.]|nr:UvrD-helicase domain-containing protein [Rectinema sp.]